MKKKSIIQTHPYYTVLALIELIKYLIKPTLMCGLLQCHVTLHISYHDNNYNNNIQERRACGISIGVSTDTQIHSLNGRVQCLHSFIAVCEGFPTTHFVLEPLRTCSAGSIHYVPVLK